MLRVGKLTDYGTAVMTSLAQQPDRLQSAAEIAAELRLTLPTVSKVLKALVQHGLVVSLRGAKGGYSLAVQPKEISVAQIIAAIEGPIALTECSDTAKACEQESLCSVRGNWQRINKAVLAALQQVTLADLARPAEQPLRFMPPPAASRAEGM
jgi:FeS assembly SUF system regulator